jgi:aminopeptidase N
LPEFEKLLTDSSYETIAIALEKLYNQFPEQRNKYLEITQNTYGTRGLNVRIKWLELSAPKNNNAMLELISYTSQSYEFTTRKNAMEALQRLNFFDELLLENIIQAMLSFNSRLATPAAEVLKHFYHQNNYKNIIAAYIEKSNYSNDEKVKLKKMIDAE